MVVNDSGSELDKRGAVESIASKPAPTGIAPESPKWNVKITHRKDFMTKSTGKPHEIAFPMLS
jgi:hypothetical protein